MKKDAYFDVFDGPGWPASCELERYFLGPTGHWALFQNRNDCWGLSAEGVDGTEHLPRDQGRIDLRLTILGNANHGVLLHYAKMGGKRMKAYYSQGDLRRLREWIWTRHGSLVSIGLFIPFERAWLAVKEFIETDGALPQSITWVPGDDLPADAFPDPTAHLDVGE
jgi:immunity protein Imm1 of predicted polymorphic toxin system